MKLKTNDIGESIKSALLEEPIVWDENSNEVLIENIDSSDPNNLVLYLENDQQFTIRIIAS